jgi:hypothetical protein
MKEPELEEEALWVEPAGQTMRIIRRTLGEEVPEVTITGPDGTETVVTLEQVSPGRFELSGRRRDRALPPDGRREGDGDRAGPRRAARVRGNHRHGRAARAPWRGTNGGVPADRGRAARPARGARGRPASGRGWIGITPREAYLTADISIAPLLPAWAFLLLASLLILGAWLREGRR